MSDEYNATIRELIDRSLEAARQGRFAYICIQFDDGKTDHAITYRYDPYKKNEEVIVEDEH